MRYYYSINLILKYYKAKENEILLFNKFDTKILQSKGK